MKASAAVRKEWGDWIAREAKSHARDRDHAIPRIIVEQTTGRDATDVEIKAIAKLCTRFDKSLGGKTMSAVAADVQAALDAISAPQLI